MRHLTLISTGGTIEKTYDEFEGRLENRASIVHRMLGRLRVEDTLIATVPLMSKDSQDITEEERDRIVRCATDAAAGVATGTITGKLIRPGRPANSKRPENSSATDGVVVLHGTDTLSVTGDAIHAAMPRPRVPIVLTGAMRPYEMKRSDALQNLTEAIFAAGVLEPGVWCVAHGRALAFPGVQKDKTLGTFVRASEGD